MSDTPIKPEGEEQAPAKVETKAPAAKKGTSGLAVAGLVLGLIALLSCWIPLFNAVTTPLAILGLVFAIIGIVATAPSKPKGGRGIAIAGTVLSAISIAVFLTMYGGAAASVSGSSDTGSDADNSAISAPAEEDSSSKDEEGTVDTPAASDNEGIVIKSCTAGKDYDGNKTAVITVEWTNETEDTDAFDIAYSYTAYVDGEEAERTFGNGSTDWYKDSNKVKKGKTTTMKLMYEWDGKSEVEFEVTKLFGNDPIVSKTFKVK